MFRKTLVTALFLAAVGHGVQAQPVDYDHRIIAPNLIEVGGGRRMSMVCLGDGSPTVLFEQGGEGSILNWKKVQKAITKLTRTCFYDRAGFGWSDPPSKPVTALNVTDDTHALLQLAGVKTPLVIVGHSIGGFYATVYADRFPTDVAGLVLIDPGFAGQSGFLTQDNRAFGLAQLRQAEKHLPECADKARRGELHLDRTENCLSFPKADAPDEVAYLANMVEHPYWYEAEYDQSRRYFMADVGDSEDTIQEMEVRRSFGSTPIVVLTAEKLAYDDWMDEGIRRAMAQHWREGHRELAARSIKGEHLVVPGASHFIQLSRSEAVIGAVTKVVLAIRRSQLLVNPPAVAAPSAPGR